MQGKRWESSSHRQWSLLKMKLGIWNVLFPNFAFQQCLNFGDMNISLTDLPCPGSIRGTCCACVSQPNFVSVMFYTSSKTTWTSCILSPGSAQAWAGSSAPCWPLKWRKQKLLLLPPCLHFCPYFLKYILHQRLCPTSPETIVCQNLWICLFWLLVPGCLNFFQAPSCLDTSFDFTKKRYIPHFSSLKIACKVVTCSLPGWAAEDSCDSP